MSNNINYYLYPLAFLAFILSICPVLSQNIETLIIPETITIERTKEFDSGLIDAPVKVEQLENDYFTKRQYQELSSGISDLPGVRTTSTQRRAGSQSALIQGFGENSVLVMIDGTPVSQNSSFGFDLSQISVSDIQKVEVIKGSASSLYGSQAMGGVINIITKRPTNKSKIDLSLSHATPTGATEGQNSSSQLTYTDTLYDIGTKISLSYRNQEALELNDNTIAKDGIDFSKLHSSIYLEKDFNNIKAFINAILIDGKTISQSSRPYSSSAFGAANNITDSQTYNIKLGIQKELDKGSIRAIVNYEKTNENLSLNDNPNTIFSETFKETQFDAKRVDVQLRNYKIYDHSITTGLLFKQDTVNQSTTTQAIEQIVVKTNDINQKQINSYESFIQDNFFLGSFELSPGVRYQYDNNFGSYAAPKINIAHYYDTSAISLKSWLSVGTGYRAPSVKERFFTLDHTSVANYIVEGNDQLSPEGSVSFQLGQEYKFSQNLKLHFNLFLNIVENMIDTTEVPSNDTTRVFTYQNIDEVISRGIESQISTQLTDKLSLKMNYTYTESINQKTNLLLANRPLHSAFVSLDYRPFNKTLLSSIARSTGSIYTDIENTMTSPAYTTFDLKLNYKYAKNIELFSALNNFFNIQRDAAVDSVRPVIDLRPSRGRELFVGVRMSNL